MLAHPYDPVRVIFPSYIQPKLDGVRAIWKHKEKKFVSRNNKPIVLPISLLSGVINSPLDLDGELIMPGKSFNEISGCVRHLDMIPEKDNIIYTIFDIIDGSLPYSKRVALLQATPISWGTNLKILPVSYITNYNQLDFFHQKHLEEGYEGSIIRNDFPYEFKRSFNLLKLKPTKEIICTIVGLIEGTGKYEGMLGALTVETPDKKIFNVGSGFNNEEREYIWKNSAERYNSIQVAVKYQDLSEYGIPRFPIFKGFKP